MVNCTATYLSAYSLLCLVRWAQRINGANDLAPYHLRMQVDLYLHFGSLGSV